MFLTKKNAIYFNKPKHIDPLKPKRILNGWQDEDQDKKDRYDFAPTKTETKPLSNLLGDDFADLTPEAPPRKETNNKFYLDWDELNDKNDIQCEKRLVEQIVQPGGIRIKPNDTMLSEFLKEIKGMEVHIIGSLLLSKIEVNYPFQTKAKALYTIDFLAKKNEVYLSYFKAHVEKLKEFPQPQDNVENYKKIIKTVLNGIGVSVASSSSLEPQEYKPTFVDPGYNDDPKSQMSNFIQQNVSTNKPKKSDNKKVIIGPGMAKQKQPVPPQNKPQNNDADFLSLDLLGGTSNQTQQPPSVLASNLLEGQMSFEDMLGGINLSNNGSKQQSQTDVNFLI